MLKKTEDPLGFFNIHSVVKLQKKLKGVLWWKQIEKKIEQRRKKSKGGPFGLVQYCMLCGKLFWSSSLGQQVKFEIL